VNQTRTYLFSGGGTGGHLTPGLAVAAELQREDNACRVLFAGSDREIERTMIASAGYEHVALPVESLQTLRRNPFRFALRNWRAWRKSRTLLDQTRPTAVIGLGGFASAPLVAAACRGHIPTIILEQNSVPGKANRWLGRRVNNVCLSLEESTAWFGCDCNTVITGNPVRQEIAALGELPSPPSGQNTLLILGGSQGATGLNDAVRGMIQSDPERWKNRRIIHQTGPAQIESLRAFYGDLRLDHVVAPFFEHVGMLYRESRLVISRAGATTLAELACAARPTILVPFPAAADNHQFFNAKHYADAGGAVIVTQQSDQDVTARQLGDAVESLWNDIPRLASLAEGMHSAARPQAAQAVVRVLQTAIAARIN
jgi:UDP-N-acetylglucosamine--N-acetylmuramyl-(pentapeptide) pyrophosphoryl-undecaprenol N-acetylglucosamine transferase